MTELAFICLPQEFAVCKLAAPGLPAWALASSFVSYTASDSEVSLVCEAQLVPEAVRAERGWRCLTVDAVLDFSLVGILARITSALAARDISVFAISTHDTDHVLVKADRLEDARDALAKAGYRMIG